MIRLPGLFLMFFFCYTLAAQPRTPTKDHVDEAKFAGIPFVSYNRSYGGIFGGFGSVYFPLSKEDTLSPASSAGLAGIYTTNGTWFIMGYSRLYFHEDFYRTTVAFGTGDQNFQYFNENYNVTGSFINYSTMFKMIYAEQMVRTIGRLYAGLDVIYFRVSTSFDSGPEGDARNYVAVGIPLTLDTRDNVMNPQWGWFANARFNRFDEAFGSATEYTKMDLDASEYIGNDSGDVVWAYKVSLSTALGSVPFEAQTVVGGKILRGYSTGEYRGDQVYAAQAEYRWTFHEKWGSVFFAGVATPVNKGESWSVSDLLPGAGAGLRYMMIPDMRINVGFDVAVGKGDYGLYFRIGEAF